jgi:hypothetical protein
MAFHSLLNHEWSNVPILQIKYDREPAVAMVIMMKLVLVRFLLYLWLSGIHMIYMKNLVHCNITTMGIVCLPGNYNR